MTQSAANFERPAEQATEPRAKREVRSVLCYIMPVNSQVDSMFEQSETVTINYTLLSGEFEWLLLACSEGCGLRNNRFKVCFAFICACVL
jgi:hypothetical protein